MLTTLELCPQFGITDEAQLQLWKDAAPELLLCADAVAFYAPQSLRTADIELASYTAWDCQSNLVERIAMLRLQLPPRCKLCVSCRVSGEHASVQCLPVQVTEPSKDSEACALLLPPQHPSRDGPTPAASEAGSLDTAEDVLDAVLRKLAAQQQQQHLHQQEPRQLAWTDDDNARAELKAGPLPRPVTRGPRYLKARRAGRTRDKVADSVSPKLETVPAPAADSAVAPLAAPSQGFAPAPALRPAPREEVDMGVVLRQIEHERSGLPGGVSKEQGWRATLQAMRVAREGALASQAEVKAAAAAGELRVEVQSAAAAAEAR